MDASAVEAERRERDSFMKEHYASPIPEEHLEAFAGLAYFTHDATWRLSAEWTPGAGEKISIPSTAGTDSAYTRAGTARCAIEGDDYTLVVLDDGDGGAFIPFRDGTSGSGTYGGGRYVPIEVGEDEAFIDFNRAYNPWCVYDEEFTCPLPPASNWITVRIPAGEKMYDAPA